MVELSILLTIVGGWTLLVYRFFAQGSGYPIGEIFYKDWPIIIGGISLIGAIYAGFSQLGFLWAIVLLIAGIL